MPLPLILEKSKDFYKMPLFEDLGAAAMFTTRDFDIQKMDSSRAVFPAQVHGDRVRVVSKPASSVPATDALITATPSLALTIRTADCLPVFILDQAKNVAALVHAGWRGARSKIISKTIQKMTDAFETKPSDLLVAFGPAIRSCCYEVGKEFQGYFPDQVTQKETRFYFDLVKAAADELSGCAVVSDHIYDSGLCTSCMNS